MRGCSPLVRTGAFLRSLLLPCAPGKQYWADGNSLTALFKRSRLDLVSAHAALRSYEEIPVRLVEIDLEACVTMGKEEGIYAYDAYMLECAQRYRVPFLLDRSQLQIAKKVEIEVLEVRK